MSAVQHDKSFNDSKSNSNSFEETAGGHGGVQQFDHAFETATMYARSSPFFSLARSLARTAARSTSDC